VATELSWKDTTGWEEIAEDEAPLQPVKPRAKQVAQQISLCTVFIVLLPLIVALWIKTNWNNFNAIGFIISQARPIFNCRRF